MEDQGRNCTKRKNIFLRIVEERAARKVLKAKTVDDQRGKRRQWKKWYEKVKHLGEESTARKVLKAKAVD